jgi:ribosomal subunit interface protein
VACCLQFRALGNEGMPPGRYAGQDPEPDESSIATETIKMTPGVRVINKHQNRKLEEYARQRLQLVLGRFDERLSAIDVHLRDENAQKGGRDKTCSIDARLIPRGTLHVHATEHDMYEAILKAVHRLETVVAKTVDRGHRSKAIRHQQGGVRHISPPGDQTEGAE